MTMRTAVSAGMLELGEGCLYEQWDQEGLEKEILFAYLVRLTLPDGREFDLQEVFWPACAAQASEAKANAQAMIRRIAAHGSVNLAAHWVAVRRLSHEEQAEENFQLEQRERHPYAYA